MNQSETRNNTIAYPQTYINPNLRKIYIPEELPDKFMEVAKSNTENNIETCGILCGVLKKDEFFVTTVILPKQTGSSDTCNTLDEVEVLNIQEKYELLTLGWIHTHPSQTGFLSSVDLHTHFSYQLMISEAIAIVCSPKYTPKVSYFRLTDNNGMNVISSCKKNGFHPHHENVKLFYDAFFNNDNGHVYNIKESVIMMDLRN
ncbi:Mov34-domain-containing protein [Piromyces finnis]|uniref:Mov34-domain-containing protein n=1 Tax=Piromyces finnis TaxID=1754191 RepID=A0A1Y1VCN4_9FUNG|nr:Mov34-domain-containing protein [Piromyces finnis]|eukprot:ORX52956.1 Mov34-domain-containing protein [Piromyces finnis]